MTAAMWIAGGVVTLLTLLLAVGVAAALGRAAADADVWEGHACPTCRSHSRDMRIALAGPGGPLPCANPWHNPAIPTPPEWRAVR